MSDQDKTKAQLISELVQLRQHLGRLQAAETQRWKTEEALRQSEARYRRIVETASEGIWMMDATFRTTFVNADMAEMLGCTVEEVLERPPTDFMFPEDLAAFEERMQTRARGMPDKYEQKYRRADGAVVWFLVSATALMDETGRFQGAFAMFTDITNRKQVEAAHQETLDQLEAILEGVADSIIVLDAAGYLIYANKAAVLAAGYPSIQEMIGASHARRLAGKFELMNEAGQPFFDNHFPDLAHLADFLDPAPVVRWRHRDTGQERWLILRASTILDEQEQPRFTVVIAHDITERKKAEEALYRYARRLEVLRSIDRDILAAESPKTIAGAALRHIRDLIPCQRASVAEFDYETDRIVVLAVDENSPVNLGDPLTLTQEKLKIALLRQGSIYLVEDLRDLPRPSILEQHLLDAGIRAYVNVPLLVQEDLIGALNLAHEQPHVFTTDYLDIIEEVAAGLAIAIRQARLYEQTRRDADTKATLLHEVNHRVKNNLAAIIGMLYIEQRHARMENPLLTDLIQRIEGMAVVHELLSASAWAPLPLSELVQRIIALAIQALPRSQQMLVLVMPSPVCVTPKQAKSLALVINELATNSVKYALRERRSVGQIIVTITEEMDRVVLEFRDDGPGFDEAVLRLERQNVGLYLVRNIVQRDLRGRVLFNNDGGAVVTVHFSLEVTQPG